MLVHRIVAICLFTLVWLPLTSADELSRTDKLRVLYSSQFTFDRRGVPLITIAIAEGERTVDIVGTKGLRVLPDGEAGSEIFGGQVWRVTTKSSRPAVVEHFAVLERAANNQLSRLQQQQALWRRRGARTKVIEIGTVFGVKGRVFDGRGFVLADGPHKTARAATHRAEALARKFKLPRVATIKQLRRRPKAVLEAVDLKKGTRVRVNDAIWFASTSGQVSVRTAEKKEARYWGQVYVTVDRKGRLAAVNAVPADRLLAGLVPAEIFPSAPSAALRAQSVAARGDLLAKIGSRHLVDPYLICSRQHCQVYRGAGHEHPATTAAVTATRGLVMTRRDGGGLVKALYSAHCGGHTEHNDNVWPVPADRSLRGRLDSARNSSRFKSGINEGNIQKWLETEPDSWCARAGFNQEKLRWTTEIKLVDINRMTRRLGVGPVKGIRVLSRGRSGRANLIEVAGALGARQVRGELTIRRMFGNLRSSMFVVHQMRDNGRITGYRFRGGGWGHGVGMCQTGAIGMAKGGKSFRQILKHYYRAAEINGLY